MTAATATPSGTLRPDAIREALQLFADAELVEIHHTAGESESGAKRRPKGKKVADAGAFYTVPDGKRLALDTSKNIIIHFFVERAILATALLTSPDGTLDAVDVLRRFSELATLLQYEFRIPGSEELRSTFDATVAEFVELAILEQSGEGTWCLGPASMGITARQWLTMLSTIIVNYIEGYRIAARALSAVINDTLSEREYVKRALTIGQRMYFAGEITRREATSKPIILNALLAFAANKIVTLQFERVALDAECRSQLAVDQLEERLKGLLRGITW